MPTWLSNRGIRRVWYESDQDIGVRRGFRDVGVDGGVYACRLPDDRVVYGQRDGYPLAGMGDAGDVRRLVRPDAEHPLAGTTGLHPVRGLDVGRRINNRGWLGLDWFRFRYAARGTRVEPG